MRRFTAGGARPASNIQLTNGNGATGHQLADGRNGWKATISLLSTQTMIWNVIDRRTRRHRWKCINAIIEAVEQDNACEDADQAPSDPNAITYDQREAVSVADAITWAQSEPSAVTLYLYDEGDGFKSRKPKFH